MKCSCGRIIENTELEETRFCGNCYYQRLSELQEQLDSHSDSEEGKELSRQEYQFLTSHAGGAQC